MGVQGLWELLAPVGRRVSVETLAGKRLAIDASIWMIQFLKAMRDEKGEMVRNAHVLGFFRRICKLLFLRTKPVFVFDGGTPALKRRTVAARRRHRENAQARIRKTAEKLILNQLKTKRLEELAQEIQKSASDRIKENVNANKGKQVVLDENQCGGEQSGKKTDKALSQEALDQMLAASLAAEEEKEFNGVKTTSTGDMQDGMEEDDDDEDEEMILPVTSGNVDPSVLASLPPSLQLDLLVQMRERQIAENRQKYQKIKKTPTKFSELQIQSYLKTVAFRREIDEVQKCAAGRGLEGVQSSRIASEANREFIFSSSFTGDKQALSARAVEKNGAAVNPSMKKTVNLDSVKHSLFTGQAQSPAGSSVDKVANDFGNDSETYRDENGRLRVSRVRGLGIRMTRDLQRNLELMKEHEEEEDSGDISTDLQSKCTKEVSSATAIPRSSSLDNASTNNERNSTNTVIKTGTLTQDGNQCSVGLSVHASKAPIEISFLEDDSGIKDTDDNLFMHLVSGTSTSALFPGSFHSDRSGNESESECDWEEGTVFENNESQQISQKREGNLSLADDNCCEDFGVEWEQGDCDVPNPNSICEAEQGRIVSRGLAEEEADIEEAIRRSLQDIEIQKASTESAANAILGTGADDQNPVAPTQDLTFEDQLPPLRDPDRSPFMCPTVDVQQTIEIFDEKTIAAEAKIEKPMVSSELDDSRVKTPCFDEDGLEHHVNHDEQCVYTSEEAVVVPSCSRISKVDFVDDSPHFDFNSVGNPHEAIPNNAYADRTQSSELSYSVERKDETVYSKQCSLTDEKIVNNDTEQDVVMENHSNTFPTVEVLHFKAGSTTHGELDNNNAVSEASLNEEISILRQERRILGDEQRKLERNAESVSSEMFAECQELLQMFGLPYIIAPMEAEAQCAYMEMSNLVDGVVTDDSDVFLFGAHNVYKNIFDDRKYVETYFMKDIESELGLNRETLIRMALLLGSDYTEGVSGIGIVNAIEVVRAFPEKDGLQKFREWIESPDPSILGKLDSHGNSNSKKRSVKSSNKDGDGMRDNAKYTPSEEGVSRGEEDQPYLDDIDHTKEIFMTKHRNVSKNWHLPSSFPSESVITAYTSPQIDDSTEPFTWGKPDLLLLRKLCWERFGWDNKKADELLVPVLKEYNKHETQLRIEAFYTFNERFAKIRSQRIKKAVKGITGKCSTELVNDHGEASRSRKKSGRDPSVEELHKPENSSKPMKASKKPRRENTESQNMQSGNRGGDTFTPHAARKKDKSGLASNLRGGGGRVRGRRREGKEKELSDDSTESNASDDCGDDGGMKKSVQISEAMSELRRSKRQRKHVKYAEEEGNVEDIRDTDDAAKVQESVEQSSSVRAEDVCDHKGGGNDNHSLDVSLSKNYLSSGGGFCTDENEAQGDDDALDARACLSEDNSPSKDYLQSGGGFCMDENEMQADTSDFDGSSVKKDLEPDGQSIEPTGGSSQAIEHVESLEPEEVEAANLGLKAMPYLRKKRRKI